MPGETFAHQDVHKDIAFKKKKNYKMRNKPTLVRGTLSLGSVSD